MRYLLQHENGNVALNASLIITSHIGRKFLRTFPREKTNYN